MVHVHIIGAGMAGLAAAVKLAKSDIPVTVYEAAGQAGGRCRSFYDTNLKARIDNGNHLMLSGNYSVEEYLETVDAKDSFNVPVEAVFPFLDLDNGERWAIRPGKGRLPFWLFDKKRNVPGATIGEYFKALKIYFATDKKTVTDCVGLTGKLYQRFWDPLTLAVLNTPPNQASAILLEQVLKETFFKGSKYCRPMIAKEGLSESLVDPALKYLKTKGAEVKLNTRLMKLEGEGAALKALVFGKEKVVLEGDDDRIIFALPPNALKSFFPDQKMPDQFHPIANVHFKLDEKGEGFGDVPFLGLIGGAAHWLFIRNNIASVTISAADNLAALKSEEVAKLIWRDVAKALGLNAKKVPKNRVIREKRATFSQTPAEVAKRPNPWGPIKGVYLAGDWTNTHIPATIESAVRSGFRAAEVLAEDNQLKLA
ncbi:MAG: hydroxysqualene dehydroxylase HpnE [Alphaproteobacteria bacterium]